ncbi:MAG: shikimate dehydrogenase [Myxococcota bacterium]
MEISSNTVLCGVILHPAGHTRSPAMQNAAYAELGIDAVYLAFDVPPESLSAAFSGARALGVRQLSISIPHKEAALRLVDEIDDTAERIGAINTAVLREGRWFGTNTDWLGAVQALERETSLEGLRGVVLGAGGTARAVVHGLSSRGMKVQILNRTPARAERLAQEMGAEAAGPLEALSGLAYDVLVNTTSVGLESDESPVDPGALRRDSVVLDAVYQPERTRLLRDAQARGARTVPGKWMLVYQAAEQLRSWSGQPPPLETMARAFDQARATQAG